jgi:Ser-Thr-rich glycosyl-phosphatidyl-inositol-anchored membrane family
MTIKESIYLTFLCIALFFGWIATEKVFITEPAPGRAYGAGSGLLIQWILTMGDPQIPIESLQIDLMAGPSENGYLVQTISSGINPADLRYEWVIPENFNSSHDYFIKIVGTGANGNTYAYSGKFAIRGDGPLPLPTPTPTTPVPITSTMIAPTSTRYTTTRTDISTFTTGASTIVLTSIDLRSDATFSFQRSLLCLLAISILF